MIEQILIFALGVLSAALVWLLLLPAFWRRAARLTRAAIERGLPLTPNEIAAEQDRIRAMRAVELSHAAREIEAANRAVVVAKAETGERLRAEATFLDQIDEGRKRIVALQLEGEGQRAEIARLTNALSAMTDDRDLGRTTISGLEIQRDALTARLNAAVDQADQRRIRIEELELALQSKITALESETQRASTLRLERQALEIELREVKRELAELTTVVARQTAQAASMPDAAPVEAVAESIREIKSSEIKPLPKIVRAG